MQARMMMVAAALVLVGLSGCLDGNEPASRETTAGQETTTNQTPDEGTQEPTGTNQTSPPLGSLHGSVTDDEALPLDGAQVLLVELNLSVLTAENGTFAFDDLPEGAVTVSVSMDGYAPANLTVDIVAGQTVEVTFLLSAVVEEVTAYHETEVKNGRISCAVGTAATLYGGAACGPVLGDIRTVAFTAGPGVVASLSEVVWQPTQPVFGSALRSVNSLNGAAAGEASGTSPLRIHATSYDPARTDSSTFSHFFWAAFGSANTSNLPHSVNVHVNQPFTIHFTAFYGGPMPDGFTALA